MRCHKLFLIGMMIATLAIPVQAAVYGTLKQDMYFDVDGNEIIKSSGTGVSIIDEDEFNYLIRIDEKTNHLIAKHFVKIPGTITKARTEAAIVSGTNQMAQVVGRVKNGEMIMALAKKGSFYKVKVDDTVGYIYSTSVDESKLNHLIASSKGQEVVEYAKQFLGGKYVYGGNNLYTGVDCSGFVQQIMKHFNIALERSSRGQYASNGVSVSKMNIEAGDLVFYGYEGVDHVAIYAGNGQVIHANDESTGIVMSNLHYGKPIIGIKRVIQ